MGVSAVVLNWKRPENVKRIVTALRQQSVPVHVTVVNQGEPLEVDCDCYYYATCDFGPIGRYIPLLFCREDYTFFLDDDLLPATDTVEFFLANAVKHPDVGLWGTQGRLVPGDYNWDEVERWAVPRDVDLVVRNYFLPRSSLVDFYRFLSTWKGPLGEDDMLVAAAVRSVGKRVCLLPSRDRSEFDELPDEEGRCHRPDHFDRRNETWRLLNVKL